jgi:hypothetical protein
MKFIYEIISTAPEKDGVTMVAITTDAITATTLAVDLQMKRPLEIISVLPVELEENEILWISTGEVSHNCFRGGSS